MSRGYCWRKIGETEMLKLTEVDNAIWKWHGEEPDPARWHPAYNALLWLFFSCCWHGGDIQSHKEKALADAPEEMKELVEWILERYNWEGWG